VLEKKEVPFILLPLVQEVSDMGCDTGSSLDELKQVIPKLFAEDHVKFDLTKIDFSEVKEGWNNKVCRPLVNTRHVVMNNTHYRPDITLTRNMRYQNAPPMSVIIFSSAQRLMYEPFCSSRLFTCAEKSAGPRCHSRCLPPFLD